MGIMIIIYSAGKGIVPPLSKADSKRYLRWPKNVALTKTKPSENAIFYTDTEISVAVAMAVRKSCYLFGGATDGRDCVVCGLGTRGRGPGRYPSCLSCWRLLES